MISLPPTLEQVYGPNKSSCLCSKPKVQTRSSQLPYNTNETICTNGYISPGQLFVWLSRFTVEMTFLPRCLQTIQHYESQPAGDMFPGQDQHISPRSMTKQCSVFGNTLTIHFWQTGAMALVWGGVGGFVASLGQSILSQQQERPKSRIVSNFIFFQQFICIT